MGKEKDTDSTNDSDLDVEGTDEKIAYPKSVFFIVSNEFCERFSYYGMRTILSLYLMDILSYTESSAKVLYHTFTMFVYFFPVLGAIISDSWLGKFRTILYVSIIYACGSILLALTAVDPLSIPQTAFSMLALFLIAIGTGGIKPCVSAFGGDQFKLPQQELQLATFFSLFYFSINSGSLISTFLTPILRNNVHCFGNNNCYPLAFAVPGVLMVVSIFIFALGKPLYKIKEPKGNVFVDVVKCMTYAITHRKSNPDVEHWLDRSKDKFGEKLVSDIKAVLKVLVLYIPLPIFWALYDQQGSGWTFQAVRMDGNIGFYTILPDQMQVVNPLLILAFIPLFTYAIYPLLAKCHLLRTPLQRMCCGGFMTAIAFGISACVSIALENTYPVEPSTGQAQLRIYDTTNCQYSFTSDTIQGGAVNGYYVNLDVPIPNASRMISFNFTSLDSSCLPIDMNMKMNESSAYGIYLHKRGATSFKDNVAKSEDGKPLVRTLVDDNTASITYTLDGKDKTIEPGNITLMSFANVGTYSIAEISEDVEFKLGGTYTVIISLTNNNYNLQIITKPNSVHILWLLPQYFVITAAEIMFSITGLELSYSQAPASMKSVLQACFLLTTAFGNLIIVLIESAKIFDKQSNDFFLYTGLMVVDMLMFMWLAIRYEYVVDEDSDTELASQVTPKASMNGRKSIGTSKGVDNPAFE
ncbi:unnamed protein product [Ceutorhynchus assimilis]|uniref:Oligopeptide transporter 1 n=1 Tax=Ceutorhynchus assimilis TaxID=467358 RepID=A0A9N9MWC6_9CUCU|nr:unnamed protein product [Ceutorhynchus assimilis]